MQQHIDRKPQPPDFHFHIIINFASVPVHQPLRDYPPQGEKWRYAGGHTQNCKKMIWTLSLFWTAILVYVIVVVSTVTLVLLENRQPAKTIAWTVVLVMLPVVGLVIFYFFGQNVRKERYISRRQYNVLTRRMLADSVRFPASDCPPKYEPLVRLFEKTNKAMPTSGNGITVYNTGREWLQALLREIHAAKDHIHIETYIIEDDAVGRLVRDALADSASRGVEVRLLYDDVGCWRVPNRFFESIAASGVKVGAFLPVRFPSLTHKVNYRNHRKICVFDGRRGFIGGMNIALRYVSTRLSPWRDMQLRIEGAAVAGLQRQFLGDWYFVTNNFVSDRRYFPAPQRVEHATDDCILQIVQSSPVSRYPEIMYGITWAISHARKYLYIQTPYFMPTEPVMQALQTAAMSGVDVKLMIPEKPDSFWLHYGNDSYLTAVLQAGIKVYAYLPGFLHSKCTIADDDWCSVGSSNMDFRSFENNFETNAFIYGRTAAVAAREGFERDLQDCREIKLSQWRRRPYSHRLMEAYTRILSPLL